MKNNIISVILCLIKRQILSSIFFSLIVILLNLIKFKVHKIHNYCWLYDKADEKINVK